MTDVPANSTSAHLPSPSPPGALRFWIGIVAIPIVLVSATAYTLLSSALPSVCRLQAWFGLPCFSCGSTRAFQALLAGDPVRAIQQQPLVTCAVIAGVGYSLCTATRYMLRRRVQPPEGLITWGRPALWLALVGIIANWAYILIQQMAG